MFSFVIPPKNTHAGTKPKLFCNCVDTVCFFIIPVFPSNSTAINFKTVTNLLSAAKKVLPQNRCGSTLCFDCTVFSTVLSLVISP